MIRFLLPLLAVTLAPAQLSQSAPPAPLRTRVEQILQFSPAARRAFWGIQVMDAESGAVLFETNAEHLFQPASNTKLFTTALALTRLGADYRFETRVECSQPPDAAGRVAGDLRLVGGGDPMLSGRTIPYRKGPQTGDPFLAIDALADQVYAAGVRRIDGDIVGDDTAYVWEPYPEGWAVDDTVWDYGAPVSALVVNDNVLTLRLHPERGFVSLQLSPPLEFYSIDNRLESKSALPTDIHSERLPGSQQLRLWGTLGASSGQDTEMVLAIDDPARYAAAAFERALRRRGIEVSGRPVARHQYANQASVAEPQRFVLARRSSPPLVELLRVIDKVSQNLHAEMMLREVARARRGLATRENGLAEERLFLNETGIPDDQFHFADGSGLSAYDLVSPSAIAKLLERMYRSGDRDRWISLLGIGGEDGTLENRFVGHSAARLIHAKTGSLSHALSLSGYALPEKGRPLVFSIVANNFVIPAAEIHALIDQIALALVE